MLLYKQQQIKIINKSLLIKVKCFFEENFKNPI